MYRVDPLPHTADVGYEVTADSLDELFRGAADGLVRALCSGSDDGDDPAAGLADGGGREHEGEPETWSLERPDRERLMVAWLRELLYRATGEGRFPAEIDVETAGAASLEARIRWTPADGPDRLVREIKGVTYHGLRVEREGDGRWHARLVLDV